MTGGGDADAIPSGLVMDGVTPREPKTAQRVQHLPFGRTAHRWPPLPNVGSVPFAVS